jgi:hypothetical protein
VQTEDFAQLQLQFVDHTQWRYEVIRGARCLEAGALRLQARRLGLEHLPPSLQDGALAPMEQEFTLSSSPLESIRF